jgi:hypothetical protein
MGVTAINSYLRYTVYYTFPFQRTFCFILCSMLYIEVQAEFPLHGPIGFAPLIGFAQPIDFSQPIGFAQRIDFYQPIGFAQRVDFYQPIGFAQRVEIKPMTL